MTQQNVPTTGFWTALEAAVWGDLKVSERRAVNISLEDLTEIIVEPYNDPDRIREALDNIPKSLLLDFGGTWVWTDQNNLKFSPHEDPYGQLP